MKPTVLVLDNRDSFVFNLVDELERAGESCEVLRSDTEPEHFSSRCDALEPRLVLLSPGPGHPRQGRVMLEFLERRPDIPVLGVCLGMQAMAYALGGSVTRAPRPVHGRCARIEHQADPLFDGIPSRFAAARYHSLVVAELPPELVPLAWTDDDLVMAIRHVSLPWYGLQFHPESLLTPDGPRLLANLLRMSS